MKKKEQILKILKKRRTPIKSVELFFQLYGVFANHDEALSLREQIKELAETHLIGSSPAGYFMIRTEEDLRKATNTLLSQAKSRYFRAMKIKKLWREQFQKTL